MKQAILLSAAMLLLIFLLPVISVGQPLYVKPEEAASPPPEVLAPSFNPQPSALPPSSPPPSQSEPEPEPPFDSQFIIRVQVGGEVREFKLDDYLLGVLAAEMPASFPDEALRAQAVAARTYALYKTRNPSSDGVHPDASVCTDPGHCKAYADPSQFDELLGDEKLEEKLRDAVASTDGQTVMYDGEPIQAVFHAASSGQTERSLDVWGRDLPYLQSVKSPGEEEAPRYYGSVELTHEEFITTFKTVYPEAVFGNTPQGWFTNIERSPSGGIIRLTVGGVVITGSRLRSMFGLQSTNMTITANSNSIKIDTVGYGHGVGMSQYGAKALALQGKSYAEILQWYYQNTTVVRMTDDVR